MKGQPKTSKTSNDFIVFNPYMFKVFKSKTQMSNQKLKNILFILHIRVQATQALW